MAAKTPTDTGTSTSGQGPAISWNNIKTNFEKTVVEEPYFVYDNLGHSGLDNIFRRIQLCAPFHRIITARPPKFLPRQVLAFYLFLKEPVEDEFESITVRHSEDTINDPEINLLEAAKMSFNLRDSGDLSLSFSSELLESTYQILTLPALEAKDMIYGLKGM